MRQKTSVITATVLHQTKEGLTQLGETLGLTMGETIDRLLVKCEADDAGLASMLILEDIMLHTRQLNSEQFDDTIAIVLCFLKESLGQDGSGALEKIIKDIDALLSVVK